MKRSLVVLAALVVAITSATAAFAAPRPEAPSTTALKISSSEYCADSEEYAFLQLINDYRAENGVGPLALSATLGAAAEHHSVDMATNNFFGHWMSDGTTWLDNIIAHGYVYATIKSENIAAGNDTASKTFQQWKNSGTHNGTMLDPRYTAIGIGRAYDASSTWKWYWTTTFGGVFDVAGAACGGTSPAPTAEPTAEPTLAVAYVDSMSAKAQSKRGTTTVTTSVAVMGTDGKAVGGATVTVTLLNPDGSTQTLTGVTNKRGQASVSVQVNASAGTYTATMVDVAVSSHVYDPNANRVSSASVTVS